MGEAREQDVVQVTENGCERLGRLRRALGQRGADRAGHGAGEDGKLAEALEVGRRPFERGSTVVAEVAHRRPFAISRHGRVLSTCAFVSQARRAWAIPSSR